MRRDDAIRILKEQQKEFRDRYNLVYLSLFGPVVRSNANRPNDGVGILVKFARPTGLIEFLDLKKRIETLLGCKVEMGKPRSLKPEIRTRILQEAVRVI